MWLVHATVAQEVVQPLVYKSQESKSFPPKKQKDKHTDKERMELKLIEDKASAKRDCRLPRARSQKAMRSNLLEAIAQVHGGSAVSRSDADGAVRVKIVVRKQELKQMLAIMEGGKNIALQASASSLEQRLNVMRRRHLRRPDYMKGNRSSWRPALQSIPEEL